MSETMPSVPSIPRGSRVVVIVSKGPRPDAPPYAQVPDVMRKAQGKALAAVQDTGLQPRIFNDYSESVARGRVMGQLPSAGASVPEGSEVVVLVSSGASVQPAPLVALPGVVGSTEAEAVEALSAAGFQPQITHEFSPNVPAGVVIDQLPNAAWAAALPTKKPKWWIWILVGLALLAAGVAAYLLLGRDAAGVAVPDVVGMTQAEATAELEDAGFEAVPEEAENPGDAEEGTVVAQDPEAGTELPEGSEVAIQIAGIAAVAVPDVVGLTQAEAEAQLEELGLRANVQAEENDSVEAGQVLRQNPPAGTELEAGSRVDVVIARAPAAPEEAEVPRVTGLTQADAEGLLSDAGLKVDVIENPSASVPEGVVIAQLPTAGTRVSPGATVAIIVSTGAPEDASTVSVPNVVGEELPDAQEVLRDAGFTVETVTVPGTAENSQDVLAQVPAAGSAAPPGSVVTLLYAE